MFELVAGVFFSSQSFGWQIICGGGSFRINFDIFVDEKQLETSLFIKHLRNK
jgi:hypothetical protein